LAAFQERGEPIMRSNFQDMPDQYAGRRDPAEDWNRPQPGGWLSRSHVTIVALGCPTTSDDQLIGLQSAVARFVGLLASFQIPRFWLPRFAYAARLLRQLF
jgi:hypothetical protein